MKSVITNQEVQQEDEYPCLKVSEDTGNVVLFTKVNTGTIVYIGVGSPSYYKVGEYCDEWAEELFEPFNGTVQLSN